MAPSESARAMLQRLIMNVAKSPVATIHELDAPPPSTKRSSGIFCTTTSSTAATTTELSTWNALDEQLRVTQVERASLRLVRDGGVPPSVLDATSLALSRARGTLAIVVGRVLAPEIVAELAQPHHAQLPRSHRRAITSALTAAYQFCLEMACELLAIESLALTEEEEERFESAAFLSFAIKSFDAVAERFTMLEDIAMTSHASDELGALLWDMGSIRIVLARVITAYSAACGAAHSLA